MNIFFYLILFFIFAAENCLGNEINIEFFKKFNDECLMEYIIEALENNHDLKQANHSVEQYRFEIKSQFSKEMPLLNAGSSYLGVHFPKSDMSDFLFVRPNAYILPFRVQYEPDFLLKNRDKTKSLKKLYLAKLANRKATYISLLSDVASGYFNILLSDYLIEKQEEILNSKRNNLNLTDKKFKAGVVDSIILNDYRKKYINQVLMYENLIKNRKTMLYNFAVLLGKSPQCIEELKRGSIKNIEYTENIPKIINSDLIFNRPDLLEVENKLRSAKIDITIAKKEFFPSFNLNALYSMDSATGGNFFSWNSAFGFLVAGLTQDIFKGGYKIANLKIKKEKYEELLEKYFQTDLNALKEVNNAMNLIKQDTISENSSLKQLKLQNAIYKSSKKKLQRGTVSKMEYFDNKAALNTIEQSWASSKTARLVDYVTLYKALGGQL